MTARIVIPEEELPDWMRQANRRVDRGVLIVIAISLAVAWSFILYPGLPRTNAAESYVFRAADTAAALREGRLYPRWSPHALNGYGAPIPHFYPPGAPYAAAFLDVMFTDDIVLAVRLVYIFSLMFAGAMVYVLVMRQVNAAAGVLAATLYVYSPYVGLVAPHVVGDLSDVICLALVPMLLWAVNRMLQRNQPVDFGLTVIISATLLLTSPAHWLAGLILAVLLIGLHLYEIRDFHRLLSVLGACITGLSLAAMYWLPALAEYDSVYWTAPPVEAVQWTLTLQELFQPARQIDPSALRPAPQFTIGLAAPVFALTSAVIMRRLRPKAAHFEWLFLTVGLAFVPVAVAFFPQATWLIGIINLCLAIGGSGVLHLRDRLSERRQRIFFSTLLIIVLLLAIPVWFSPTTPEDFGPVTPASQARYEQQGFGVAVLPPGAAIPATIHPGLPASRALLNGYTSGNINRFSDDLTLQNTASVLFEGTHTHRFQIRRPGTTLVTFLMASFPGWQAYLDGRPLPTAPNSDTGLIDITVPRTTGSELMVTLDATPVRSTGWLISGLAAVITGLITLQRFRRHAPAPYQSLKLLRTADARLITVVLVLMGGLALASYTGVLPLQLRAQGQYLLRDGTFLRSRSDAGLEVYYYRMEKTDYAPGETIFLTLYWQATGPLTVNYKTELSLRDVSTGRTWYTTPLRHPGHYPTRRWIRNLYVTDAYQLPIPPDIPPGRYLIAIQVYRCEPACTPENRLNFFASNGNPVGPVLTLPRILTVNELPGIFSSGTIDTMERQGIYRRRF